MAKIPGAIALFMGLVACRAPTAEPQDPIKAFCIDFNWDQSGPNGFAKPGH